MSDEVTAASKSSTDGLSDEAFIEALKRRQKKPFHKRWWVWVIAAVLAIGIAGNTGNNDVQELAAETPAVEEVAEQQEGKEVAEELEPEVLTSTSGLESAIVTRVIDGDTIVLDSGDHVRLIGIDAPERGEPGSSEATEFVRSRIVGQTVWLEPDGSNIDRHDRLRRYVWIVEPTDPRDEVQIREHMLNYLLLSEGHAEVMIVGSPRNAALFRAAVPAPPPEIFLSQDEEADSEVTVWLSATGSSWHSINNCGRMNPDRATEVTLEEARRRGGLSPCSRCNPPE